MKKSNIVKGVGIAIMVFATIMLIGAVNAHISPSIASSRNSVTFGVVLFGIIPAIIGLLVYKKALKIQKDSGEEDV